MKKHFFIGMSAIALMVSAQASQPSVESSLTNIPYVSTIMPKDGGGYKALTSVLSIGTKIVKGSKGTCWKEHTELVKMEEIEYQGFKLQMPHTKGYTMQEPCDTKL